MKAIYFLMHRQSARITAVCGKNISTIVYFGDFSPVITKPKIFFSILQFLNLVSLIISRISDKV